MKTQRIRHGLFCLSLLLLLSSVSWAIDESMLTGRYNFLGYFHDDPAGSAHEVGLDAGYAIFDGISSFSYTTDFPSPESGSATYAIDTNGRLLIDGEQSYGFVSPDGSFIIIPVLDPSEDNDLGFSILLKSPLLIKAMPWIPLLLLDD